MAAGLGFKTFTTGEVLTAADTNGYLMQGILVFASEAARNSAITSPQEGQFAYTKDTNSTWYYDGAAWVASGASGDVTGITAGTGITVTSPGGPVPTVTNDMATTITAAGDIVVGTGSGTYDNLPIGTTGQILTADTTVSPYKVKWATAAGGGGMTLLSTTALSGSSTSVTSISGAYNTLFILVNYGLGTTTGTVSATLNSATSNYLMVFGRQDTTTNGGATANIPINAGVSQQDSGDGSVCISAINIYNYTSTSTTKPITFSGNFRTGTSTQGINGAGTYVSTSAITSFQMNTSAGTLEGSIRIYGVK